MRNKILLHKPATAFGWKFSDVPGTEAGVKTKGNGKKKKRHVDFRGA